MEINSHPAVRWRRAEEGEGTSCLLMIVVSIHEQDLPDILQSASHVTFLTGPTASHVQHRFCQGLDLVEEIRLAVAMALDQGCIYLAPHSNWPPLTLPFSQCGITILTQTHPEIKSMKSFEL